MKAPVVVSFATSLAAFACAGAPQPTAVDVAVLPFASAPAAASAPPDAAAPSSASAVVDAATSDDADAESDDDTATGDMFGDSIGDSFGAGGLGLSGSGQGGGGSGQTIGLGNVGTLGHGAGTGTGQGFGDAGARQAVVPSPRIREGVVSVNGLLPTDVVRRAVRQNLGRFRLCYDSGLRKNPKLAGAVVARFVINPAGTVTASQKIESSMPDAAVEACVVRGLRGVSFPKPDSGLVTVTYRLDFFVVS
jgi:hypothetical protein